MVGDHYRDKWWNDHWVNYPNNPNPGVTKQDFDQLRREVEDLKKLLIRARKYDEERGEPDCEIEDKMEVLRKVAKLVGVSLDDVIPPK